MEANRQHSLSDPNRPKYLPPEPDIVGPGSMFSFSGRIGRATFWKVQLYLFIALLLSGLVLALVVPMMTQAQIREDGGLFVVLGALFLAFVWTNCAALAKRFHDLDKSGWMVLLTIIPLVGFIAFIWAGAAAGTDGPNRFGTQPLRLRLFV